MRFQNVGYNKQRSEYRRKEKKELKKDVFNEV